MLHTKQAFFLGNGLILLISIERDMNGLYRKPRKLFIQNLFPWFFCFIFVAMEQKIEHLLKKVAALYNRYGIRSVTMDDVAHELGISKKTLYHFVKDKNKLVERVMDYINKTRAELFMMDRPREMNAIEELFFVNRKVHQIVKDSNIVIEHDLKKYHPAVYEKGMAIKRERMYRSMLENLRKGKKEGLYRKELNEEIIAKTYLLRMDSVTTEEVISVSEFTSTTFINELYLYHIRGVASKKGIEFLEKNLNKLIHPEKPE